MKKRTWFCRSRAAHPRRCRAHRRVAWVGVIGAWGWIGVVPLATGIFRVCPAYLPFG